MTKSLFCCGKNSIGSTLAGQLVDSALFTLIAFAGVWDQETLIKVIVGNYLFKVTYEIMATPMTYAIVRALKRAEHEDFYDRGTVFNPFTWKV